MNTEHHTEEVAVEEIADRLGAESRRVMLLGAPGTGKSTLAARLAAERTTAERPVRCLNLDPGTPAFGLPGAVGIARWHEGNWISATLRPLCTLDAARFRLPLVEAARELIPLMERGDAILDIPGVVRGTAGAELFLALVELFRPDRVVVLARNVSEPPLVRELQMGGVPVWLVEASERARRPGAVARYRHRTMVWDEYLAAAESLIVDPQSVVCVGTPPPVDAGEAWRGRQVALMDGARLLAMGEVKSRTAEALEVRVPPFPGKCRNILVRDARRGAAGFLRTAPRFGGETVQWAPPPDLTGTGEARGPQPVVQAGGVSASLVNGVFGDPLLHLRLRHRRRGLLFDLGESGRLPAKLVHQVSDVFISHAHADHIGGFIWFLRSRMGEFPACRFYGPPGLAGNIEGFLRGIHWDRIGNRGPRFEVAELHDGVLEQYRLQAGYRDAVFLGTRAVDQGILLDESDFRVRAVTLDHGGTPVLAFAFEPAMQVNVRRERLDARGWAPGPWLTTLKRLVASGDTGGTMALPDGSRETVARLSDELLLKAPGRKIAYATDLADTPDNASRLAALAQRSHVFFCEAGFLPENADQAKRTGHLTTRACAAIANKADVVHLVPFHFSARYEHEPARVYDDVGRYCSRTVVPDLQRST